MSLVTSVLTNWPFSIKLWSWTLNSLLTATNAYAGPQHGVLLCGGFRFRKLVLKSQSQGRNCRVWLPAPGMSAELLKPLVWVWISPSHPHHVVWRLCVYVCALQELQFHTMYFDHTHPFPNSSQIQPSSICQLFAKKKKKILPHQSVPPTYSIYPWMWGLPLEPGMFLRTHSVLHV